MRKWLMVTDSYKSGYYPWPPENIVEPDITGHKESHL
jgi:hypothetical protein